MQRLIESLGSGVGRRGLKTYRVRLIVQVGFALALILMGLQFARFVGQAESLAPELQATLAQGLSAAELAARFELPLRPPGVEGFLPISGLMGMLDWIYSGELNPVHPAATVLFIIFVAMAYFLRKAFCSWICPVGLLSETLARLGRRLPFLRGRNFRLHTAADVPLRGIKYLLLGFFLWIIGGMSGQQLQAFIGEPYNRVADVKMLWFFTEMSGLTAIVLIALSALSVLVHGFWCRYLCPYGALLGLVSWASPLRVRRNTDTCTDCGLCDRVCMARLPVSSKERIISPECTGCLDCVASCPTTNALGVADRRQTVGPLRFALLVLVLFFTGYTAARVGGAWHNEVSDLEYIQRIPEAHIYDHPR